MVNKIYSKKMKKEYVIRKNTGLPTDDLENKLKEFKEKAMQEIEEAKKKEELRIKNTLLEYNHEIQYCKEALASGVTGSDKKHIKFRLKEAKKSKEKMLFKLLRNRNLSSDLKHELIEELYRDISFK